MGFRYHELDEGAATQAYLENEGKNIQVDRWDGCYSKRWNGILSDEAYVHPAKVAPGLAEKIYQHMIEEGWLHPGDTFWGAARKIVEQVYFSLKPGGHAAWIVKSYVKAGQIVDFHDQWRQLCESVGFVTVHEHRAYVVEEHNPRYNLDGELVVDVKERKSFFRRLLEKKGSPRIDWETVWCMVKPEA